MAYGLIHALTGAGIISLASTPIGLAAGSVIAFASHWPLDDLNVDGRRIYHHTGDTFGEQGQFLALQIIVWGLLLTWSWFHPWCFLGIACALLWDTDHVITLIKGKKKWDRKLHINYMWPDWMRTKWGLCVWTPLIALGMILIWW